MDVKEEMKLREWAQDMVDQKSSGLTHRDWCMTRGVSISTFEYRCRKVRTALEHNYQEKKSAQVQTLEPTAPSPVFAKVNLVETTPAGSTGIHIRLGDAQISIASDASCEQIRTVLEVLGHAR